MLYNLTWRRLQSELPAIFVYAGDGREDSGAVKYAEGELEEMGTFGLYPSGGKVTDKPQFCTYGRKEVLEKVEAMRAAEEIPAGRGKG